MSGLLVSFQPLQPLNAAGICRAEDGVGVSGCSPETGLSIVKALRSDTNVKRNVL